jgi:hypothetical protein
MCAIRAEWATATDRPDAPHLRVVTVDTEADLDHAQSAAAPVLSPTSKALALEALGRAVRVKKHVFEGLPASDLCWCGNRDFTYGHVRTS